MVVSNKIWESIVLLPLAGDYLHTNGAKWLEVFEGLPSKWQRGCACYCTSAQAFAGENKMAFGRVCDVE